MTLHFNRLTEAEQERLVILLEECAEVIQAGSKILRHGYESVNPKAIVPEDENPETNRAGLERELGDLSHALIRMTEAGDLREYEIRRRSKSKPERIKPYLHHQPEPPSDRPEQSEGAKGKV